MKMHTNTIDHKPISLRPYGNALSQVQWLDELIDKLLKAGMNRSSASACEVPVNMLGGNVVILDHGLSLLLLIQLYKLYLLIFVTF